MNENSYEQLSPYKNPDLIAQSNGDRGLLDRLVALHLADEMLQEMPGDEKRTERREFMRHEVEAYKQSKKGSASQ